MTFAVTALFALVALVMVAALVKLPAPAAGPRPAADRGCDGAELELVDGEGFEWTNPELVA